MARKRPLTASTPGKPHIHVVGGGISGLTAALRLAERGYQVTVYEERGDLGGNLGGHKNPRNGCYYDVYPHMFGDFYENFWDLAEGDLGMQRGPGLDFEPHYTFKVLDKRAFPKYIDLLNTASPVSNLFSGVASPADIVLSLYSMLDGLTYGFDDDDILDRVGVDGFLFTRPYGTPGLVDMHDDILMTIWSVHGYAISSAAYRRFVEHNVPVPVPLHWLLTGDLLSTLIQPLEARIESYGGVIQRATRVEEVALQEVTGGKTYTAIREIKTISTAFDATEEKWKSVKGTQKRVPIDAAAGDRVILALPPQALAYVLNSGGPDTERIVDRLPNLAQVRRLSGEPIPVMTVYFNKKLPNIPKEYVLLRDSSYNLTFLDLSQNWHHVPTLGEGTVLCVAASDFYAIPWSTSDSSQRALNRAKFGIIQQLHKYLPVFDPGTKWGESKDINWAKTEFTSNQDRMLFSNRVGGKEWQPVTHYDSIPNLYFAGDCTINHIRMATVESAVVSGLNAAQCVWEQHPLGSAIEVKQQATVPSAAIAGMKTLMAPWAYAARWWAGWMSAMPHLASGDYGAPEIADAALDMYSTPWLMAADVWQSLLRTWGDYSSQAMGAAMKVYEPGAGSQESE